MKIAIYTLGCKVNQYETQAIEQELRRRGHELVPFPEAADAWIFSSPSKMLMARLYPPRQEMSTARPHLRAVRGSGRECALRLTKTALWGKMSGRMQKGDRAEDAPVAGRSFYGFRFY